MDQSAAPLHGARQAFRVAQVALGQGEVQTLQIAAVAAGADQGAHGMAPREEGAGTAEPTKPVAPVRRVGAATGAGIGSFAGEREPRPAVFE